MNADTHPTYPNPTIHEAICDIHFRLQDGIAWNPSWYGEFSRLVQDEFPNFQPVLAGQLQVVFGQAPPIPSRVTMPLLMRYEHPARSFLLQLSDSSISVNVLPIYPGWTEVSRIVAYAWSKIAEVTNPAAITRIGLRYINRIERSADDEVFEDWFLPTEYIPPAVLRARQGFRSQTILQLDDENRVSLTVADLPPTPGSRGAFIFDIDRVLEYDMLADTMQPEEAASRLHEHAWEIFRAAKGDRLEALLQGDYL